MADWKVSTRDKKSVVEVEIWTNDKGQTVKKVTGFRWGSWVITTSDDEEPILEHDSNGEIDMYSYYENNIESIELDMLDDGWFMDWEFSDDVSEEEQKLIIDGYDEDGYDYLETNGWFNDETLCLVSCDLDIEPVLSVSKEVDQDTASWSTPSESEENWIDKSITPEEIGEYEVVINAAWPMGGMTVDASWDGASWKQDGKEIQIHRWKNL